MSQLVCSNGEACHVRVDAVKCENIGADKIGNVSFVHYCMFCCNIRTELFIRYSLLQVEWKCTSDMDSSVRFESLQVGYQSGVLGRNI
jgi:hypothetical protein